MANQIRYGILDDATDESWLWELTLRSTTHIGRRTIENHPERTIDQVRPELVELLRQGFVELYEETGSSTSALDPSTAVAVVADDANWLTPAESGRDAFYSVVLREVGDEEFQREAAAQRSSQ